MSLRSRLANFISPAAPVRRQAAPAASWWTWDGIRSSRKRTYWPTENVDAKIEYDSASRERVISDARRIYRFLGFSKAVVDSVAQSAVGSAWQPQFRTDNPQWNELASEYVARWYGKCDIRGYHDFPAMLRIASRAIDVDGEVFFHFVKGGQDGNWPLLQAIHAHRSGDDDRDYKGPGNQVQGIILNDAGRPLAYSFTDDDNNVQTIDAVDIVHLFDPRRFDEVHGVSGFAAGGAIANATDLWETLDFEKQAQKAASETAIIRSNATGEVENPYAKTPKADAAAGAPVTETRLGGATVYTVNGEKFQVLEHNRPRDGWFKMAELLTREICLALGVPYEACVNPEKLTGPSVRNVMQRFQRAVDARQAVLMPFARRTVGWVVAGGIKRGELPAQADWWRFDFQMPRRDTIDQGREALAEQNDYRLGLRTLDDLTSETGMDWVNVRNQRQAEVDDLLTRAKALAEKHGIQLPTALALLEMRTPNASEAAGEKQAPAGGSAI